ncbi:hypothetical protein NBRC116588_05650 [Pyruvatibacter sp. HU-CL02332]|uniref:hypothetical protein n=1 Tax=Pyruvatibacter sp. HU-CL02332 TaxID=3127650 RepID=UPI00310AEBDE
MGMTCRLSGILVAALLTGSLVVAPGADARGFRSADRIMTPELLAVGEDAAALSDLVGEPLSGPVPIPRLHVEQAMEQVLANWGDTQFRRALSDDFVDGDRLADTATLLVPRDAQVRVLGISNIDTLDQVLRRDEGPDDGDLLVSRITLTAQTQVEYVDRTTGAFRLLRGTNDYVLLLRHRFEEVAQ